MAPKQAAVEPYFVSNANGGGNVLAIDSVFVLPAVSAYVSMANHATP